MHSIHSSSDICRTPHKWSWYWVPVVIIIYGMIYLAVSSAFHVFEGTNRDFLLLTLFCSVLYTVMTPPHQLIIPAEVILFGIWLLWCLWGAGVHGTLFAYPLARTGFWADYRHAFMVGLVFFVTTSIIARRKSITPIFFALLIGSLILMCLSVYTGEYQMSSLNMEHRLGEITTGKSNGFGFLLFFGVVATSYFVINNQQLTVRILNLIILVALSIGIILSASRKVLLGECLFISLVLWLCYRRELLHKRSILLAAVGTVGFFYICGTYVINNTFVGNRFLNESGLSHQEDRINLYRDWTVMAKKDPIFGVGIGNFVNLSRSRRSAHSDYVSVFSETGIVGGILYFSVYVILWRRFGRVQAQAKDPGVVKTIAILKAAVISILCMALGQPIFNHPVVYILVGTSVGFLWSLEHFKDNCEYLLARPEREGLLTRRKQNSGWRDK